MTAATIQPAKSTCEPVSNRLHLASVCTLLPSQAAPHRGIFVRRRLAALAQFADVRVLQPNFYFPVLRSGRDRDARTGSSPFPVEGRSAFYIPGVLKRFDGWWLQRAIAPVIEQWHRERPLDLIDAHFGYPEGVGCAQLARRLDLPLFITVRGNETDYLQMSGIAPRLRQALHQSAGVIAVSHSLRDLLVRHGIDEDRIAVVPNGVDSTIFHAGDRTAARRVLGLRDDRRYLVSVGQVDWKKGHGSLIRAFASLRRSQPELELILIGSEKTGSRRTPRQLARELQVDHAIRFVGSQPPDRVGEWLRAADLFVLPSHREGCCNAVLEALSCGLPVITTPVGDNERYVQPDENGFIIPIDDDRALAAAIEAALARSWDSSAIAVRMSGMTWESVARLVVGTFHRFLR